MRKETLNYFMAPLFFFIMLVDAHLTNALTTWNQGTYIWSTHLLLLFLLFSSNQLSKRYMILSTLVIGGLFDMYYIGVLGIYMVALPLVVWLMYLMENVIHQNIFTYFFGMIVFVTAFDLITASIQVVFKLTTINGMFFITHFLGPTLLINIVLFFALYYPLKKLFSKK